MEKRARSARPSIWFPTEPEAGRAALKFMKKLLKLLPLLLLLGCGPKYGNIVAKEFVPAHTVRYCMPVWDSDGNLAGFDDGSYDVPDRWYVTIQGTNNSGKTACATLQVPLDDFNNFQEGQLYPPAER